MTIQKKETFVQVVDKRLRVQQFYQESGENKPTIVFLHEGLGSIELWKDFPQMVMQATGLNILLYERQGHGQSEALNTPRPLNYLEVEALEYLPVLLEQLGIQEPILLGHSDGGTIALLYAAQYPVKLLITAAAHVLVEDITVKGIQDVVAYYQQGKMLPKLMAYHGEKAAALFAAWADTWLHPEFRNWNVAACLSDINCPALLLQGKEDEYATDEHLNLIVDGIGANARGLLIDGCGHSPHIQAKEFFLEQTVAFIQEQLR